MDEPTPKQKAALGRLGQIFDVIDAETRKPGEPGLRSVVKAHATGQRDLMDRLKASLAHPAAEPQGEPSEAAWRAGEQSVADAAHFAVNLEPQHEPSDAQVLASAIKLTGGSAILFAELDTETQERCLDDARAALRANGVSDD